MKGRRNYLQQCLILFSLFWFSLATHGCELTGGTSQDAAQADTDTATDAADAPADMPTPHDLDASDADLEPDATELDLTDTADGDIADVPQPSGNRNVYPIDQLHSPITPALASVLRALAEQHPERNDSAFAKVGASSTVSTNYLHCFAGGDIDLAGRPLQNTVAHFSAPLGTGEISWNRESLAAVVGWSALSVLAGMPSPLQQEFDAVNPRFALVMYGTNDIQLDNIDRYAGNMLDLVEISLNQGVIPILSTIPPRDDSANADAQVPHYNAIIRGIAEQKGVPFVDYHSQLAVLPDHGLSSDGIHPTVYRDGGTRPCVLNGEGLQYGYNVRNLISLEALDRVRRIVVDGEVAPDAPFQDLIGDGTTKGPILVDRLPFSDLRDTRDSITDVIDDYTGCDASQDESGPEYFYRLEVSETTRIRASVFDRGDVDIDIHLLDNTMTSEGCVDRAHRVIEAELTPGTWHLVLDTYVSSGSEKSGEYLLIVSELP